MKGTRTNRASSSKIRDRKTVVEEAKRFQRTKSIWTAITEKNLRLRDREREFHGFQGELRRYGDAIRQEYEKSKSIRHIRDRGAYREEIIRAFLSESGLIPHRYGISQLSARVTAPTGFSSKELDILFYDRDENLVLRKFGKTLEFFPIETVYGTIQVKSQLTYAELENAFDNIASFKKLYQGREEEGGLSEGKRGFGIIFAFGSNLAHEQIVDRITSLIANRRSEHLPNSIVVLGGSVLRFGDENGGYLLNRKIDNLVNPRVWGDMDITGDSFWRFYAELITLLRSRICKKVEISDYFDLPLVVDDIYYRFRFGVSSETGKCPEHGEYSRRLNEGSARRIYDYIVHAEPLNWIRALDISEGKAGDNEAAYDRQPGMVRIYNPESWPLDKILRGTQGRLLYDDLEFAGYNVWVPWIYDDMEGLFCNCPQCAKAQKKGQSAQSRRDES